MESLKDVSRILVAAYGELSIYVYALFAIIMAVGYYNKSSLLQSRFLRKFVEYFGNVSPSDDSPKAKAKSSRSARVTP